MKEMKFSSQICTTKEQSKQLLELGLKPETADMVWHHNERSKLMEWELRPFCPTLRSNTILNISKLNVFNHKNAEGKVMTGEEYFDKLYGKDIPAWSLHRLKSICVPDIEVEGETYFLTIGFDDEVSYKSFDYMDGCERVYCSFCGGNLYSNMVDCIEWLIDNWYLKVEKE